MEHSRKHPDFQCDKTIVLVGMMGAGKTTVGRRLAPRIGLPFFDADSEIEQAAGMSVSELFQRHGEESFRDGEARVIARLLDGPAHVLATGGGALTHPETRQLIADKSLAIWLKADTDVLARRATRRGTRPLLATGDPEETLARLMESREAYYGAADIHIESQPGPHALTVNLIVDTLAAYLGVAPPAAKDSS
ncbi:Shikimate kinase I [hydrothermal vent metagenome]|uniref:shikimate kinase n=1 Tax=hydrothermal vent metagenome TaxID=652676 RepID=A0A3B0S1A7_9ZZZZ